MKTSHKVFLACAFGGFIGAFVALWLSHYDSLFAFVGFAIGGFTGYLSYNIHEVIAAILQAWASATNWRPDKAWWRMCCQELLRYYGFALTVVTGVAMFVCGAASIAEPKFPENLLMFACILVLFWTTVLVSGIPLTFFWKDGGVLEIRAWMGPVPDVSPFKFYGYTLPKFFLWMGLKALATLIGALGVCTPGATMVLFRFFRNLIQRIHSDVRVVCAVDAMLGAVAGYFFHDPWVGALIGGVLGVLNYEILSIRIFKLVPATQSMFSR